MTDLSIQNDLDPSPEELAHPIPAEAMAAAPAPTDRERRKAQQRVDARSWYPRENVAVLHRTITVGSPTLRKGWDPAFVRTQIAMHMLQEVLPSTSEMEQARAIEKLIDERLTSLENEMHAEYSRLLAVANSDGVDTIPAKNYPGAETIQVPVFTPGAGRYLNLLVKVDDLLWLADYLWLSGMIKLDHKWQLVNRWKRLFWDFVKFTTQTWIRARSSLRKKQDEANKKRRGEVAPAGNEGASDTGAVAEPVPGAALDAAA